MCSEGITIQDITTIRALLYGLGSKITLLRAEHDKLMRWLDEPLKELARQCEQIELPFGEEEVYDR